MADRPILFSAPMVRALLAGTKTQTRREIKPRGTHPSIFNGGWTDSYVLDPGNASWRQQDIRIAVGDRLYVRESWWIAEMYSYGTTPGGCEISPPPLAARRRDPVHYAADGDPKNVGNRSYGPEGLRNGSFAAPDPYAVWLKKPSIHMPRWASRLTLTVTGVRVERLLDISETDAIAEGIERSTTFPDRFMTPAGDYAVPVVAYQRLWESINGPWSWQANPWIVAYSFTVQHGNIDQIAKVAA
jgi:hypothetical protein